jgi:NAD(P)H dehydrogenase (quinone)
MQILDKLRSLVNRYVTVSVTPPPSSDPPCNVLVVFGNPDSTKSFSAEISRHAVKALLARGNQVKIVNVSDGSFDPLLRGAEFTERYERPVQHADLQSHVALLKWCDKIVWIYPTWWSSVPAGLKGWIDRVFAAGIAYKTPTDPGANILPLLSIKKTAVITTWGGSNLLPLYTGDLGRRLLCRSLTISCYRNRFPETLYLKLHNVYKSESRRETFLAKVEDQMKLF